MGFPSFATGEVLTAADMNAVGMWLIKSETFTTADPYNLTSVFSSTYRNYQIIMDVKGSANSALYAQFLSGTTTPFTSALYYRYGFYVTGAGTYTPFSASLQTEMFVTNTSTTYESPIVMTVLRPNISNRPYVFIQSFDPNAGLAIHVQHQVDTTTQFTGIRFDAASGSVTGRVRVYGYRD